MGKAKNTLKLVIGRAAEFALPELAREIDEARNIGRAPKLKRAIHYARLRRADSQGDAAAIERTLTAYWRGEAEQFHDRFAKQGFARFQKHHAPVIETLAAHLQASGAHFSRLVEIGCGDGAVLADCVGRLPGISRAVGLDINGAVIARITTAQSAGGRLSFAEAEARDWLIANPQTGTVVLSNGGVLEYFSQKKFDSLLGVLAQSAPAAIVLIEPVAPDHDLKSRTDSYTFGRENSFSHNHRHRLSSAGFTVTHEQEMQIHDVRWMLMIGILAKPALGEAGSSTGSKPGEIND